MSPSIDSKRLAQASPKIRNGRIAQLVEQLTLNQRVLGSNPSASTIQIRDLGLTLASPKQPKIGRGNKWGNKRRETKPVALHPFRASMRRTLTLSAALDIIAETFKVSLSGEASYLQRTFGENLCANLS